MLRDATLDDLPAILEIHNDAITTTTAIWDEEPVEIDERRAWFDTRTTAGHPIIVATDDGVVAGYASFGPWRPKSGYRHTVEHSVYIHPDRQGRGHGRALMAELIERARTAGFHAMVAGIEAGNAPSLALHEHFGFTQVALLPQVGRKFDRWLDLAYLQLLLD